MLVLIEFLRLFLRFTKIKATTAAATTMSATHAAITAVGGHRDSDLIL